MSDLTTAIRAEIEDLHAFFVDWFTGAADQMAITTRFGTAMAPDVLFISPDGQRLTHSDLMTGIGAGYGANTAIRIAIRNVEIQQDLGDCVLVTYEEWQIGGKAGRDQSGRLSTALITKAAPHKWLHIHETWLPYDVQAAGPYDF